jgi:hypothetical protein
MSRHVPSAGIAPMPKGQLWTTYSITNLSVSIALEYKIGAGAIVLKMQEPYELT